MGYVQSERHGKMYVHVDDLLQTEMATKMLKTTLSAIISTITKHEFMPK